MGTGAAAITPVLSAPGNNNQTTQYKSTPFSGGFSVQNEAFLLYLTRVSLVFWYYKGLFWFYLESLLVSVCTLSPWHHVPTTTCVCLAKRYLSREHLLIFRMNLLLSTTVLGAGVHIWLHWASTAFALDVLCVGLLSAMQRVCMPHTDNCVHFWWAEEIPPKLVLDMLGVGQGSNLFFWHWFGSSCCVCYSPWNLHEQKGPICINYRNLFQQRGEREKVWGEKKRMYFLILLTCLVKFLLKLILLQSNFILYFSIAWLYPMSGLNESTSKSLGPSHFSLYLDVTFNFLNCVCTLRRTENANAWPSEKSVSLAFPPP